MWSVICRTETCHVPPSSTTRSTSKCSHYISSDTQLYALHTTSPNETSRHMNTTQTREIHIIGYATHNLQSVFWKFTLFSFRNCALQTASPAPRILFPPLESLCKDYTADWPVFIIHTTATASPTSPGLITCHVDVLESTTLADKQHSLAFFTFHNTVTPYCAPTLIQSYFALFQDVFWKQFEKEKHIAPIMSTKCNILISKTEQIRPTLKPRNRWKGWS